MEVSPRLFSAQKRTSHSGASLPLVACGMSRIILRMCGRDRHRRRRIRQRPESTRTFDCREVRHRHRRAVDQHPADAVDHRRCRRVEEEGVQHVALAAAVHHDAAGDDGDKSDGLHRARGRAGTAAEDASWREEDTVPEGVADWTSQKRRQPSSREMEREREREREREISSAYQRGRKRSARFHWTKNPYLPSSED